MTLLLILILITSINTFAQSGYSDSSNGLEDNSWADSDDDSGTVTNPTGNTTVDDVTVVAEQACEKKHQTSIPDEFFAKLLKGKTWKVTRDSSSGTMNISSEKMISNCNSMIRYNFSEPKNGKPYLFQVEIRKPANCNDGKCKYKVAVANDADNPQVKTGDIEIEVEPTYFGFLKCLELTGAMKDGKPQGSKIITSGLNVPVNGLTETAEVAYYCRGPVCDKKGFKYGKSNITGGSCETFSQMAKDGYTYYSAEDVEINRKKELFNQICRADDYKQIDKYLPDFAGMKGLYSILQQVRNNLLAQEVKALHKELEAKSYAGLDADKYRDIIRDYYSKVIKPLQARIARLQNAGYTKHQDQINELTKKLISFNKSPYLTSTDYDNMKSFLKKAPLQKETWREAALYLYSSQNTAYHYSRYNSDIRGKNPDMDILTVAKANDYIKADIAEQKEELNKLGQLAADPKKSFRDDYIQKGNNIQRSKYENAADLQRFEQQEMMYMQQNCLNPQRYWMRGLIQQNCVRGVQQNIMAAREDAFYFNQSQDAAAKAAYERSNYWAQIEAQRNGGNPQLVNPAQMMAPQSFNFTNPGYTSQPGQPNAWNRGPAGNTWGQGQTMPWGMPQQRQPWGMPQQTQPWGMPQQTQPWMTPGFNPGANSFNFNVR